MKFNTHFIRERSAPEVNQGETLVEKAGYISAQERIENMILAGQRLVDYRRARHDFEGDEDLDEYFEDPTRDPGFDRADATMLELEVHNRFLAQAKADKAVKASQTAQEGSGSVPPPPAGD